MNVFPRLRNARAQQMFEYLLMMTAVISAVISFVPTLNASMKNVMCQAMTINGDYTECEGTEPVGDVPRTFSWQRTRVDGSGFCNKCTYGFCGSAPACSASNVGATCTGARVPGSFNNRYVMTCSAS